MCRKTYVFLFAVITVLFLTNPSSAQDTFIILNSSDIPTMLQNVKYLESLGGTISHRFPPNVLIGNIPESKLNNLAGHMNIVKVETTAVDVSDISKYGRTAKNAADAWNNNYKGKAAEKGIVSNTKPEPGPIIGDMLILPENTKLRAGSIHQSNNIINEAYIQPYMAGFYDTSEYLIGDIAVGIIFLESNGSIDPNREDWTGTEESNVTSEIQAGLNWWMLREPHSQISFTYDINYRIPTSYEPITRPADPGESLWVTDAMSFLGYTDRSSYIDNAYDYANSLRAINNANWAFTIFVIDSSIDTDGLFVDGYFAYAYLGGPFLVMTYDNDGYIIANMDAVAAHETGHIFYALDQYTQAGNSCNEKSGYLAVENQNSAYPSPGACLSNVGSIMRSQVSPYTNGLLDLYARQQVGWRDTNSNNIMDIIDFLPVSTLNSYSPDPANDNTPAYTGSSTTILTYTNMNPYGEKHSITINKIANVQFRVDTGLWMNALPAEGLFDISVEGFIFTAPELSDGTHLIEVRALNQAGNWETVYANDIIAIDAPPNSITDLKNKTYSLTSINWTWIDPSNSDFDHVEVYLNQTFKRNVSKGVRFYNATGLFPATSYNISTRTVDISGNINQTWVYHTDRTREAEVKPPTAVCGHDKLNCENINAPVQFNGSESYDPDGVIVSYSWEFGDGVTGTGVAPNHTYAAYKWNGTAYQPFINLTVTDDSGLINRTSQNVTIWIAGDANGDGKVNILDASAVGLKWNGNDPCADLNNDGKVNILDSSIIGLNWGKIAQVLTITGLSDES